MTRPYTPSRPAMRRVSQLCRKCGEFAAMYRLYRKFGNARILSAQMARDIAFKPLPF